MLLRFTSPDMLNSSLLDADSSDLVYKLETTLDTSSSSSSLSSPCSHLPEEDRSQINRTTEITDAIGVIIARILWRGRRPTITIGAEEVGGVNELFNVGSTEILPNILSMASRLDENCVWKATPTSLTLYNADLRETRGVFHLNAIRVPTPQNAALLRTGIPGVGHNFIEFQPHAHAQSIELIVAFIIMEILRRGRFSLNPYMFERSKFWAIDEAKYSVLRRLRRNTC